MSFEEIRSGNVENIMLWRESLSLMQDSHFILEKSKLLTTSQIL